VKSVSPKGNGRERDAPYYSVPEAGLSAINRGVSVGGKVSVMAGRKREAAGQTKNGSVIGGKKLPMEKKWKSGKGEGGKVDHLLSRLIGRGTDQ